MFSEVLDIVYSEITRMCDARKDKTEQEEIAKSLVKKALLEFYYDWKTRSKYVTFDVMDNVLRNYAKKFIDISVEVRAYDILPDSVTDDLLTFATRMRNIADEPKHQDSRSPEYMNNYDRVTEELLNDVFFMYNHFGRYFKSE